MTPFPAERDVLFRDFAKALFESHPDGLHRVVVSEFRWKYYDGISQTKYLVDKEAIGAIWPTRRNLFLPSTCLPSLAGYFIHAFPSARRSE
jgi:hypothetical protein